YLVAAIYAAILWRQSAESNETSLWLLALAGFLTGGAVSCKYPAVIFGLAPLAAWVGWQSLSTALRRAGTGSRIGSPCMPPAIFLAACAAGCGAWLVKNAALTGNPTYPLLYDWFDGLSRTFANNQQWVRAHDPPNYEAIDLARRAAGVMMTSD